MHGLCLTFLVMLLSPNHFISASVFMSILCYRYLRRQYKIRTRHICSHRCSGGRCRSSCHSRSSRGKWGRRGRGIPSEPGSSRCGQSHWAPHRASQTCHRQLNIQLFLNQALTIRWWCSCDPKSRCQASGCCGIPVDKTSLTEEHLLTMP